MRFGTPTSALTVGAAAIAFLAPFAAAAAAAVPAPVPAPVPTGAGSAPEAASTSFPVMVNIQYKSGEGIIKELQLKPSQDIARANRDIVGAEWTTELTFTPEEAAEIDKIGYIIYVSYPWLEGCYAVYSNGETQRLETTLATVDAPTRLACAAVHVGDFMEEVFARSLNLQSEGGFLEKIGF